MRFIKRFIVIIVLLLIAFFIYRLINPSGAKSLLYDVKSLANDKIGTHFSLEDSEDSIEGVTGSVIAMTGNIFEETGALQEMSEEDELLLVDIPLEEAFIDVSSQASGEKNIEKDTSLSASTSSSTTFPSSSSKALTSSPLNNGLSAQELDDVVDLLQNFQ